MQQLKSSHFFIKRDMALIPLYRKGFIVDYALIDKDDLDRVKKFKWSLSPAGYAYRRERRSECPTGPLGVVYLQRFILKLKRGNPLVADHKDGETLDNRKKNLEAVPKNKNAFARIQQERRSLDGVQTLG